MAKQGWTTESGKADSDVEEDDANYYCYYVLDDPKNPEKRHYFFNSQEKAYKNYRMGVIGLNGEYLTTVEAVEAYLKQVKEKYGEVYPVEDLDQINGYEVIMQKQSIARNWFTDQWKISFDDLRNIVQRRQKDFDINALRSEVESIQ